MTEAHHTRSHAVWSASATAANVHCPGRLAMVSISPPDIESKTAAWGTACHQIAEHCLRDGKSADEFAGMLTKTERFEFEFDDEMIYVTQEFVTYCVSRGLAYEKETQDEFKVWIERKFSFAALNPPFEAGGTGDCILYFPEWKMLEIVDLKAGRGVVVEVKENYQARSYALGALLAFSDLDVETVRSTIVQPRAPHADGRIRSEDIPVGELIDWTVDLLEAMQRSKQAKDEFDALGGNSVLFDEWVERWLRPGKCTFCPAAGLCPALKKQAHAAAGIWFDELDKPVIGNAVPIESTEALGRTLDSLEMIEEWISSVRAYAHQRAENGETIPGWMLVDKIGNRAWKKDVDAETIAKAFGVESETLFLKKLKSPAQTEALLGPRKKEMISQEDILWEKPVRGTNLVSETKTTRARSKSKPEQMFDKLEN